MKPESMEWIAKAEGDLGTASREVDLLLESLELREDIALAKVAGKRAAGFDPATALTDDQIFGHMQSGQSLLIPF